MHSRIRDEAHLPGSIRYVLLEPLSAPASASSRPLALEQLPLVRALSSRRAASWQLSACCSVFGNDEDAAIELLSAASLPTTLTRAA